MPGAVSYIRLRFQHFQTSASGGKVNTINIYEANVPVPALGIEASKHRYLGKNTQHIHIPFPYCHSAKNRAGKLPANTFLQVLLTTHSEFVDKSTGATAHPAEKPTEKDKRAFEDKYSA